MNIKHEVTVKINKAELEALLKQHLSLPENAKVYFNFQDRYSSYEFSNVSITYEVKPTN